MPIYVYETIPNGNHQRAKTYEIRQSMKDDALTRHPDTGEPIRRVMTGGYGFISHGEPKSGSSEAAHHCCGGACGCHHHHN